MHLRTPSGGCRDVRVAVGTVLGGPAATRTAGASTTNGRIAVFGDSLAVQAGPYIERAAEAGDVKLTIYAFPGTAPCDFLGVLQDALTSKDPGRRALRVPGQQLRDVHAGPTRGQPLAGDAMIAKYRADLEAAADQTARANRPLILASPPAARGMHELWQQLDDLYRQIAATHPGVQYLDAGTDIAPGGQFAADAAVPRPGIEAPAGSDRCAGPRDPGSRSAAGTGCTSAVAHSRVRHSSARAIRRERCATPGTSSVPPSRPSANVPDPPERGTEPDEVAVLREGRGKVAFVPCASATPNREPTP